MSKNQYWRHQKKAQLLSKRSYRLFYGAWTLLSLAALAFVYSHSVDQTRERFDDFFANLYSHVGTRISSVETFANGLTVFIEQAGNIEHETIHNFTQRFLEHVDTIYYVQLAQRVNREMATDFAIPNPHRPEADPRPIRTFHNDRKKWSRHLTDKNWYFPIVIAETRREEPVFVYGYDITSPAKVAGVLERLSVDRTVAITPQVKLRELEHANLVYIPLFLRKEPPMWSYQDADAILMLIIDARDVVPGHLKASENYSFVLQPVGPSGEVVSEFKAEPATWLTRLLFPELQMSRVIENRFFPMTLSLRRQITLFDINLAGCLLVLLLSRLGYYLMRQSEKAHIAVEQVRKSAAKDWHKQAHYDSLTHIPNRHFLEQFFERCENQESPDNRFGLLYVDVDNFKKINDRHGHVAGDQILKLIASCLKNSIRASDLVARVGGDEFVVVITGLQSSSALHHIRKDILFQLETLKSRPEVVGGEQISVSIGSATSPEDGTDLESLMSAADREMYRDKDGRRRHAENLAVADSQDAESRVTDISTSRIRSGSSNKQDS